MCCPVDNLHYWTQPNRLRTTICISAQTLTVSPAAGAERRGPDDNLHSFTPALYRGWRDKIETSQRVILNIGHYEMKVALLPLFCWCFIVMLIHLLIWQEEIWIHCIALYQRLICHKWVHSAGTGEEEPSKCFNYKSSDLSASQGVSPWSQTHFGFGN